MTTLHLHQSGAHQAMIVKQPKGADTYRAEEPWMLLYDTGRIERFATQAEAKAEARKHWGAVVFSKGE